MNTTRINTTFIQDFTGNIKSVKDALKKKFFPKK